MKKGAFAFVLHTHLPFVRKAGVWPFGEEWFYEAMAETYIPILDMLNSLRRDGCRASLTISLTPVLLEQMADEYMLSQFRVYVADRISRAESDIKRFSSDAAMLKIARFYREFYSSTLRSFDSVYRGNVTGAFRDLQDAGYLEIIASAATHGYLPLLIRDSSIYAQVETGVRTYEKYLGRKPKGFWLPECAYRPSYEMREDGSSRLKKGIDEFLRSAGIDFFIVDTHAFEGGESFPASRTSAPGAKKFTLEQKGEPGSRTSLLPYVLGSECSVFARNRRTGMQVWSGEYGYPGDGNYREFHKKDSESGLQYWKITNAKAGLGEKEIYAREKIYSRVCENASHLTGMVGRMLSDFSSAGGGAFGIVVAPYDSELFGHWWFEGVMFLEKALRALSLAENGIEITTRGGYLEKHPPQQAIKLPETSWGAGGYHHVWLNSETEKMWVHIHEREKKMEEMVARYGGAAGILKDALDQAGRELLLLESSDWPFLVTTGQAKEYGRERFSRHCENFDAICGLVDSGAGDEELGNLVALVTGADNLFADLDYNIFACRE